MTIHPSNGIRDVRMIERAIREKWDIRPEAFQWLPNELLLIILDRKKSDRERIAAAKAVVQMHGQNEDAAREDKPQLHLHAQLQVIEEIVDAPRPALGDSEADPAAQASG